MYPIFPSGGMTHSLQSTTQETEDAKAILRNNHWSQDALKCVWENPSKTQFINESHLEGDPKGAISSVGMDWDSEMRSLNTTWTSNASKRKGWISNPLNDSYTPDWTYKPADLGKTECSHEWSKYTGLNEVFTYCKLCDKKL